MAMVIWEGRSLIDGSPIVALATFSSRNSKTGAMTQTHIVRADMPPGEAIETGADTATCGDCIHRSVAAGGLGSCYVHPIIRRQWGTPKAWQAWADGRAHDFDIRKFVGRPLRLGTYGDPAAVPATVWYRLVAAAGAAGHTGYTHQWRDPRFRALRHIVMASCDTDRDRIDAAASGWNTFTVHPVGTDRPAGTKPCPASAESGRRLTCQSCLRCGGTSTGRRGNHVAIMAHGGGAARYRLPLAVVS